jgi:hypothetical protein
LLQQNEAMNALEQLRDKSSKREVELRRQIEEKRSPPMFWENSESFGEGRDVEWEIFEALKCVVTMGEGFKETLWGLWKHFSPLHLHLP